MIHKGVHKGLAGVVVDTTAVSKVMPESNSLTYRGYPVQDLAAHCSFEEVAYLLWHGELPTGAELASFREQERAERGLSRETLAVLTALPDACHPMDVVRTMTSYLGAADPDEDNTAEAANHAKALRLFAVLPTIVAADMRRRRGLAPIPPDTALGYSQNFLQMCFGEVPDPLEAPVLEAPVLEAPVLEAPVLEAPVVSAFEQSMILYAEHGFNASTFAARVVTSTESDMYSAVTAAIGALKGRLHGGANEAVMRDMLEIGSADNVSDWLSAKLSRGEKVMGFGHRVYKHGDSRVPTMHEALRKVAAVRDGQRWLDIYHALEAEMAAATGIKPNVDFPTGPAYHLMRFDIPMFTALFVMSRITGWTAHIVEQAGSNALIRPLSEYSGRPQRALT